MLHKMKNLKSWPAVALAIVALFVVATTNVIATSHDVQGLVFIDDNLNGVWDVGEAGYDGEWQWVEDEGVSRYVGATVTIITPAYDEFEVETSPLREMEEGEEIVCTPQDLVLNDDEINPNPVRPCIGTWGLPLSADETYLEIRVAVEGYMVTSPNPQYYLTGTDTHWVDFGIAPLTDSAKSIGGPVVDVVDVEETAVVTPAAYSTFVAGTEFVPGLVFIDDNEDGIWQIGEAGYGGEWQWVEDEEMSRYVGATIMLISPAYDEFEVETMPYRELEEDEEVACSQQDLMLADDEFNPNPVRPCSGAWGLSHAGDDVRWEVWLTVPDGYRLTSANPQYYVTGSGQIPLDFGIAPLTDSAKNIGKPVVDIEETEAAVVTSAVYSMCVEGTEFVPGLVFIDDNEDGIWQIGEAGYGGEWQWVEDEELSRYVGATITLISPAYDEFEVETTPYRELEENEEVACSQQDLVLADGEINPNPIRPCSGAWGLSHAGDDVRWEVRLTVPDGYRLTSANPQYYATGCGQLPIDFGIVPISVED